MRKEYVLQLQLAQERFISQRNHFPILISWEQPSHHIDGKGMSEIHPRWDALLRWLSQEGMNTSSILVEARRTEGKCGQDGLII